ncbi:MAG: sodium-dependent transporter [Clostridia bacterium]|nr:sodium-dependent transporter [Clostridia bacterium]
MSQQDQKREIFGSRLGFLFAAAGSAIGLGSLWRFPWLVGANGGSAFLIIYLVIAVFIGISLFMCELVLGRATQSSNVGAFRKISPSWASLGGLGPLAAFLILCFYSVVGGWIIYYFFRTIAGLNITDPALTAELFNNFTADPVLPLVLHGIFMGLTMLICYKGVVNGIEKASTIMMPILFAIIVPLAVRALTLPGAAEGLRFYLVPDFSRVTAKTFMDAMGQVFFSLSLGMGATLTYGSYLGKHENIPVLSLIVTLVDVLIGFMAGIIIFPIVFSFGFQPGAGTGLTFITMPAIFSEMPAGKLFGSIFFFLFFLSALTSSISLLEAAIAYLIEEHGWDRKRATLVSGTVSFVVGCLASLAMGPLSGFTIKGLNFFGQLDWVSATILQPLCGILTAILVSWIWGSRNAIQEITSDGRVKFALASIWTNVILRCVAPISVGLIFLAGLGVIRL